MPSIHNGDNMTKKTRPRFNPEFKVESAQLVSGQGYSVRKVGEVYPPPRKLVEVKSREFS